MNTDMIKRVITGVVENTEFHISMDLDGWKNVVAILIISAAQLGMKKLENTQA